MQPIPPVLPRGAQVIAVTVLLLFVLSACGVKAPPVPPQRPPLAVAENLAATVAGDTVTLTWRHDGTVREGDGYEVFRAATDPDQPPCPGCPLVFQKAGTIAADRGAAEVVFSETLPAGFIYTYKVRAVGRSGDRGADSRTVVVDRAGQ